MKLSGDQCACSIPELEVLAAYADTSKYFSYTKAYLAPRNTGQKIAGYQKSALVSQALEAAKSSGTMQAASPSMHETTEMLANADANPAEVCVIYNFTS